MSEHPDLARLASRVRSRPADAVSTVFDPLVLLTATMLLVGATHAVPWVGVAWALAAIAGCALVPEAVLRLLVRAGRVGDRQLVVREQRHVPMLVAAVCVGATLALLVLGGAPRALVAVVITLLVGLAVMTAMTHWWKASIHADVAATCATILGWSVGAWTLAATAPIVAAVCWARVRAGRHSPAQVLAGAALGVALTAAVLPKLT